MMVLQIRAQHRNSIPRFVQAGLPSDEGGSNGNLRSNKGIYRHHLSANANNDIHTYASLLQAATHNKSPLHGKLLHRHVVIAGHNENIFLGIQLATMYSICGRMVEARLVFDKIPEKNAALYNIMIKVQACNGGFQEALALYYQMQRAGIQPDNFTFPFVLKACAALSALQEGKEIHHHIARTGYESNVYVGNALVVMYAKCGVMDLARQVFDKMPKRNIVSWNAVIAGHVQNGHASEALTVFRQMQLQNVKPSLVTIVSVLRACAQIAALERGEDMLNYIIKNKFELDGSIGNSLVAMYCKCGRVEIARKLFDKMSKRDVVSWNAMIGGYAQSGHAKEALMLFRQMQMEDLKPDQVTIVCVLPACADLADLQQGKDIHDYFLTNGFESDVCVENSLVAMYARCGRIELARQLFDKMSERNIVSWNAMISGYAQSGHDIAALSTFLQMQLTDIKPNSVTILSVIPALSHLAALHLGKWFHAYIIRSGFEPNVVVCTAFIDMYAKCGSIDMARQLFDKMSKKNMVSWSAMIAGYAMHGLAEEALSLFRHMQQTGLKPDHITFTHVLCACNHAGLVDYGCQYFKTMIHDYCITPRMDHYACMVDLLGRAGRLDEAEEFIEKMPLEPNASVWGALLSACKIHCNVELGERVAERLFDLEPEDAGNYVLLSNMYATAARWNDVAKVRTLMKDRGLKKMAGCSTIEVNNRVHSFLVGDRSHPQSEKIYEALEILTGQMKEVGYVPNLNFVLNDVEEERNTSSRVPARSWPLLLSSNRSCGTPIQITKDPFMYD